MGGRLWYPEPWHLVTTAYEVADLLFPGYDPAVTATSVEGRVRDWTLLESAVYGPRQPYYPRLPRKAAALMRSLIKNHPFVDGNKRVGVAGTFLFLAMNDRWLAATNADMIEIALTVAGTHGDPGINGIEAWLRPRILDPERDELSPALRSVRSLLGR